MRNIIAVFYIAFIIMSFSSCNSNPLLFIPFGDEKDAAPGKRDYTWTSDTLEIPFTTLYGMWGNAVDNVWAVGPGGGLDKTIWQYDGINWSTDGVSRNIAPECIWGFGKNDIWTGGNFGKLWHYDGNSWTEKYQIKITGYDRIWISDIYGDNPNDIYSVGVAYKNNVEKGFILHYSGYVWELIYLASFKSQFLRIARGKNESTNYYIFYITNNTDSCTISEFDGKNLRQIRSSIWNDYYTNIFQSFNNKMYFMLGDGVYKYWDGCYFNILKVNNPANFAQQILARSQKDIFLLMYDGVAHFNGNTIEYLFRSSAGTKMYFRGGVILEKDVFILEVSSQGLNIIHHGKLINSGG